MQETNFFLSALQPEDGVCSLALPSDQQLDMKSKEASAADSELLKSARVQEQVRMRMLQKSHSAPRANGGPPLPDYPELKGRRRRSRARWGGNGASSWAFLPAAEAAPRGGRVVCGARPTLLPIGGPQVGAGRARILLARAAATATLPLSSSLDVCVCLAGTSVQSVS